MKRVLIRWHRRIGITSSLFVFILAVTGLFLLLSEPLKLSQVKFENALISKIYHRTPQSDPIGFKVGSKLENQQWVVMVDGLVYVGSADPIPLSPPLVNAAVQDDNLIIFSNHEESIITLRDGTLVERMTGVERMAGRTLPVQAPMVLPNTVKQAVLTRYRGQGVPASRVILDIHTGRFFGKLGPWIMGLASVFLIILSISGVIMWTGLRKRKKP